MRLSKNFPLSGLIIPVLLQLVCALTASAADVQPQQIPYTIIVTGAELLTGVYADGHTQFITRSLLPMGLHCVGSISVDDRAEDMKRALRYAAEQSQMIIVTGGLGPTKNDITRQVLSDFTGIALKEHPEVLSHMERRFRTPAKNLRGNLRRQAQVPVQGTFLSNASGTAVGLVFEWNDKLIIALPGPPRELQPMVNQSLLVYLAKRFGRRANGCSLTMRFVGLGQSQIDQTMKDHIALADNITLATQFTDGRVDFTFSLPEDSAQNRAILDDLRRQLQQHLGDFIYATEMTVSLEQAVVSLLAARRQKLCLLEIGSGGSLAAAISNAGPQHAAVLAAGYVAPTTRRLSQMFPVSRESATDHAAETDLAPILEAATLQHADHWIVAIGPREGDPGRQRVAVAFQQPNQPLETILLPLRDLSRSSRARLTTTVLDQLRRRIQAAH